MDGYTLTHKTPTRKDFLDTADFDQSEIMDIINTARTRYMLASILRRT